VGRDVTWIVENRRWLNFLPPLFLLLLTALGAGSLRHFPTGVGAVVLGQGWRLWAAGCLRKGAGLTTCGPFALTRNPLYLGSFIIGVGHCLICGIVQAIPIFVILFALVYYPTILSEETLLRAQFGERYQEYSGKVPRFLPAGRGWRRVGEGFSLRQVIINREYEAVFANAAFVILVLFLLKARG